MEQLGWLAGELAAAAALDIQAALAQQPRAYLIVRTTREPPDPDGLCACRLVGLFFKVSLRSAYLLIGRRAGGLAGRAPGAPQAEPPVQERPR